MSFNEIKGKKIIVAGAGASGIGAAKLICALGGKAVMADDKAKEELPQAKEELSSLPVKWMHLKKPVSLKGFDAVIASPGFPVDSRLFQSARAKGLPVYGELELAYRHQDIPIVAVTGSNGKTTVASLTQHMLRKLGYKSWLGGNIGDPFSNCVLKLMDGNVAAEEKPGCAVLEVSSFQLETADRFHAHGAALLNLTPDHLDRHGDMAEYLKTKMRIYSNQTECDLAVVNEDDPLLAIKKVKAKRFGFSKTKRPDFGAYAAPCSDGVSIRVVDGEKALAESGWKSFLMQGRHNQENLMAAVGLAMSLGADPQKAMDAAFDFKVADHRLEFAGRFGGVSWYDDSKGTNVGAVAAALENFKAKSVILILGGRDKDMDFRPLRKPVKEKVRHLILLGESKDKIRNCLKGSASMTAVDSMAEAVSACKNLAKDGDSVLLSPACASFDMFQSYKHRGEVFQAEVRRQHGDAPEGRQGPKGKEKGQTWKG